mgnify:CR=1 FL=1
MAAEASANYESKLLDREIGSLDDVRRSLMETAFLYRKTAQMYIWLLTGMIATVVSIFIIFRYFHSGLTTNREHVDNVMIYMTANISVHAAILVLIIYLSQLLVGFSRYHYRVADKLFSQSNAVTLSMASGETEKVIDFVKAMTLDIDFGKMPSTPIEKIADAVSKILSSAAKQAKNPQ